jgi:hypothetical protein
MVLFFTGIVSAQIKTQNFSSNLPFQQLSSAGDFSLPAFDASLGTLQNIQLSVTITGTVEQIVYNSAGKPIGFKKAVYSLPGSISGPGAVVLNAVAPTPVTSKSSRGGSGLFLAGGIPLKSYTPHQTVISESDPSVLDLWQSPGNNAVDLSYTTSDSPLVAPNLSLPNSFRGTASVTVAYTYDSTLATPEPPGKYLSAIVAAGMIFIFLGRRKLLSA